MTSYNEFDTMISRPPGSVEVKILLYLPLFAFDLKIFLKLFRILFFDLNFSDDHDFSPPRSFEVNREV